MGDVGTVVPPVADRGDRAEGGDRSSRAGHLFAAVLAIAGLYVANHLLDWGFPPFLTDDFDRVLPLVNLSFGASLAVNAVRVVHPGAWLVAATDLISILAGLPALVRTWQVFPFDFDRDGFRWDLATRVVLIVAIVGSIIGLVVGAVRLVRLALGWR